MIYIIIITHQIKQYKNYIYKMSVFIKNKEEIDFISYKKILQKGLVKYKDRKYIEYKLAKCYMFGLGVKINHKEAIYYLKLSANEGHMKAQYYLSQYYEKGIHIGKDLNEAFILCKKSAEQNYMNAEYKMGLYYDYMKEDKDKFFTKDIIEAFNWYKKSAEQGHVEGQYAVGEFYDAGEGVKKNIVEAFKWYKKAADQNHVNAQCNVGIFYENGEGVEKNMVEALKWYKKSADQGYYKAEYNVGVCYEHGLGNVEKNLVEALKWYKKSADQGYYKAEYNVGVFYEHGLGNLEINLVEAVKYYKKADHCGYSKAQHKLANCYKYEKGITKNLNIAFMLYDKAIKSGSNCACTYYQYALCYERGEGVIADIDKAFTLYKKSVELGCSAAHYKLAECYQYGKGTQININEANKLYIILEKLGYKKQDNVNCIDHMHDAASEKAAFQKSRAKTKLFEKASPKVDFQKGQDLEKQDLENPARKFSAKIHEQDLENAAFEYENISQHTLSKEDKKDLAAKIIASKNKINDAKQIIKTIEQRNILYKKDLETHNKKKLKYEKELNEAKTILQTSNIKLGNNKLEMQDLLNSYIKTLESITKFLHSNDIYSYTYNDSNKNDIYINKINMLLEYSYNCGVLNHKLGNYKEAIKYYEEAAYNKYPFGQKALAYCYKHGVYYEKSLEKYKIWYNLYLYKCLIEDVD